MSRILFVQVEAFRLFHSDDHRTCDYVAESNTTISLDLNDQSLTAIPATWGHASLFTFEINPDDILRVRIRPSGTDLFPVDASFCYTGGGRFSRYQDTPAARAGVALPEGFELLQLMPEPLTITRFRGFLPAINEVSDKVRDAVRAEVVREVQRFGAMAGWSLARDPNFDIIAKLEEPATAHWLASPVVDPPGTALRYKESTVDPRAHLRAFELAGVKVPGLVLASLPKDLQPVFFDTDLDKRLSCLLMIRPRLSNWYEGSPYPYGINHLWDAGLKYMGMLGLDPILQKYPAKPVESKPKRSGYRDQPEADDSSLQHVGLMHQVAAGGRRAAVIMPMLRRDSLGRFADADFVERTIHEIYAWELRANEMVVWPSELGPCAIAGFSSGNDLLATWLNQNRGRHFCDHVIREVYSIDAPHFFPGDGGDKKPVGTHALEHVVQAAEAWAARGDPGKVLRFYNQSVDENLNGFKRPSDQFPMVPFELSIGDTRTLICTPVDSLNRAALGLDAEHRNRDLWQGGYKGGDHEAHQIINATAFVDALRRSVFPKL